MRPLALALVLASLAPACSSSPPAGGCSTSRDCSDGEVCLDSACVAAPVRDGGASCGPSCECVDDSDCSERVPACVEAACVEGSCFFRARSELCSTGTCDLTTGCGEGPADAGPIDAGAPDASTGVDAGADGGPADAGPIDAGSPRPIGSSCTADEECAPVGTTAPVCLTSAGTVELPGGYCSASCALFTTTSCGRAASCVRVGDLRSGRCLDRCTTDADCRTAEGYQCRRPDASLTADLVCIPPGL
jgi:hypothetical protein